MCDILASNHPVKVLVLNNSYCSSTLSPISVINCARCKTILKLYVRIAKRLPSTFHGCTCTDLFNTAMKHQFQVYIIPRCRDFLGVLGTPSHCQAITSPAMPAFYPLAQTRRSMQMSSSKFAVVTDFSFAVTRYLYHLRQSEDLSSLRVTSPS
jgi:hypothetical protein